jgi:copper chaperone CopZ
MTCEGCKASVEEKLMRLPNINRVEANLVSQSVSIYSNSSIEYSALQEVLPEKYNLTKVDPVTVANRLEVGDKSDLKKLFPLILIFIYITTASVFINFNSFTSEAFMFDFMGLFYVVFSFFKFLDYKGFPKSFKMYDPLAKKSGCLCLGLPIYRNRFRGSVFDANRNYFSSNCHLINISNYDDWCS